MKKHTKDDLVYFTFEHFDETGLVRHGFSTRLGGVSDRGNLSSLNLGYSRGDKEENVNKNYEIFCSALGIDTGNLVFSYQTHTTNVLEVSRKDRRRDRGERETVKDIDGLITNERETALVTFYADCVPLLFLDPVKKAVGAAHAGWRGTLNKIAEEAIRQMGECYGSKPRDILAGIGPSIGGCCFEVNEPVLGMFKEAEHGKNHVEGRYINLWEVNKEVMLRAGLRNENIEISSLCTKCNGDLFYSHRNMGEERGSLAAIMELI